MSARALEEAEFGPLVSVIPPDGKLHATSQINPKDLGKAPGLFRDGAWGGYPFTKTRVDAATIERTGANVGLLGDNFPGLDIDVDDPTLSAVVEELALKSLGDTAVRHSREPRRLLVYRTNTPFKRVALLVTYKGKTHTVEFLGVGRQYLVHGKHPSGVDYRWPGQDLWDYLPSDLPLVDGEKAVAFLQDLKSGLEGKGIECEMVGTGAANDAPAKAQDDLLAPSTKALVSLVTSLPNPADWDRSKYVQMACAIKAAAEDEETGKALFRDWAATWEGTPDPEYDERTYDSLTPPYRVGWSWLQEQAEDLTGGEYVSAADEFEAVDAPEPAEEAQEEEEGLVFVQIGDFLKNPRPPVKWLVEGMLPASSLSMIAAKPKCGKTTLARALAVAVSKGEPWLERATTKGRALYLSLEDPDDLVHEEFERLGSGEDDDLFIYCGATKKGAVKQLAEAARKYDPSLIVVDTLQRLLKVKDVNDYAQVTTALDPFLLIARETRAHIMFVHHSPKGDREDVADAALGSTALFGSVDVGLFLRRTASGSRYLSTRQRRGEDMDESVIELNPKTHVPYIAGTKRSVDLSEVETKILEALNGSAPVTEADLVELVEARTSLVRPALRDLVIHGHLERSGKGQRGDPYKYAVASDPLLDVPGLDS